MIGYVLILFLVLFTIFLYSKNPSDKKCGNCMECRGCKK